MNDVDAPMVIVNLALLDIKLPVNWLVLKDLADTVRLVAELILLLFRACPFLYSRYIKL